MTTQHEQLLAAVEADLLAAGVPREAVDVHIAERLRVPYDHYVAYLLVWGAIEAYRLTRPGQQPDPDPPDRSADGNPRVAQSLRVVWEHAGAIHQAAVNGGDIRALVREQARDLIGELLELSEQLMRADVVAAGQGVDRG